jgi:hypothetical protein
LRSWIWMQQFVVNALTSHRRRGETSLFVLMNWQLLIVCRDMALLESSLLLLLRPWQWLMAMVSGMKGGILLPVTMTILDC